jgi:ABC-2 type transport system permease protein
MLRYAFRLHRWGMLGFGLTAALSTYAQGSAYQKLAGSTPADHAAFVKGVTSLAKQLSYLLPLPTHVETLAGYVLWRSWGTLPIIVTVWAVSAACGAVRGDEEKLLVDAWLASRVSRTRLLLTRFAAFGLAAAVMAGAAGLGTLAGAVGVETIPVQRLAGQALALWLFTMAAFAVAYLVAQVPGSIRGAQGAAAGVLLAAYMVNALGRSLDAMAGAAWVSPFHWFEVTDVLAPGGHLDIAGSLLSTGLLLAAGALAVLAFRRRDLRRGLLARPALPRVRDVPPSPALRWPVARELYRQRWMVAIWALATLVFAAFMVAIGRGTVDSMMSISGLRVLLTRGGSDPYRAWVGLFWFSIAQLLLAGLAIHMVSAWAADDGEGVLTAELSRPRRRWGIVLERAGAALVAMAVVAVCGAVAAWATGLAAGISLDPDGAVRATWLLVPFGLSFAAIGAVGSVWWPRASVGALGIIVFLSYLLSQLGPILGWPDWVVNLSAFQLYGTPALTAVSWSGLVTMLIIVVAGFGASAALMERREVTA